MKPQPLVVVGVSAGGVESLMALAASLPADFAAPVLAVLHVAPHTPRTANRWCRGTSTSRRLTVTCWSRGPDRCHAGAEGEPLPALGGRAVSLGSLREWAEGDRGGPLRHPRERLETGVRVAGGACAPPLPCPDCHGTLVRLEEGDTVRFRCPTGHAFSAGALLAGLTETVEDHLWQVIRALEEGTMLLHQLGEVGWGGRGAHRRGAV